MSHAAAGAPRLATRSCSATGELACGVRTSGPRAMPHSRALRRCDVSAYHLACLPVPLATVPEGDWYCPACVQQRGKKRPADAPQEPSPPSPPQGQCFVTSGCLLSQPHEGPCIVPHEGGRARRASRGKGVQRLGINDSWRALAPPAPRSQSARGQRRALTRDRSEGSASSWTSRAAQARQGAPSPAPAAPPRADQPRPKSDQPRPKRARHDSAPPSRGGDPPGVQPSRSAGPETHPEDEREVCTPGSPLAKDGLSAERCTRLL